MLSALGGIASLTRCSAHGSIRYYRLARSCELVIRLRLKNAR